MSGASKSTADEIRARFDQDVERFSNLETGQSATMDAPLALELIAACAAACTPGASRLLDVGCGAGNYSLKLLERLPALEITLVDLSLPMLERARQRLHAAGARSSTLIQADIRAVDLGTETFDIILAAAVLHHLRVDVEWEAVFGAFYHALAPGGSLWIFDMVESSLPPVQSVLWHRYGDYLTGLKGTDYRDHVFAYIEKEDTPRSLRYQLHLLERVGFQAIEVLHKNGPFAAFGAIKA